MKRKLHPILCLTAACLLGALSHGAEVVIKVGAKAQGQVNRNIFGGDYCDIRGNQADWAAMKLSTCR